MLDNGPVSDVRKLQLEHLLFIDKILHENNVLVTLLPFF